MRCARTENFSPCARENISNIGARAVSFSPLSKGAGLIPGPYDIPAATLRAVAVYTNTMPTQAYRSSGRPEVTYAIERLVDNAAAELGFDRVSLRRKNLIKPKALPYRNAVGMLYDSGEYEKNMNWAMDIADWKGFSARKREARKRGKLLGLGLCNYIESSIGAPREQAQIHVRPEGRVDVVIGTQPSGQGHETSFAQVVSDLIKVPVETVKIILGDTDVVKVGGGSHSGRSMRHAATVFSKAAVELIDKGRRIAAIAMDVAPEAVEFTDDGRFAARDTNRSFDFFELAKEAAKLTLPTLEGGPVLLHQKREAAVAAPSPPAGEGMKVVQQTRMGEGVSSQNASSEEAPSPDRARGHSLEPSPSERGRGRKYRRLAFWRGCPSPSSPTTRCTSRCSPTARRSARSRSIPTPAASTSCAMPRSTTSAAPSIR